MLVDKFVVTVWFKMCSVSKWFAQVVEVDCFAHGDTLLDGFRHS